MPTSLTSIVSWLVSLLLAGLVAVKRRVIWSVVKRLYDRASTWFWNSIRRSIDAHTPPKPETDSNQRSYRGVFQDYWYTSLPHRTHLLKLTHDGMETTVEVFDTPLLIGLKRGNLVEIDTETSSGIQRELVKRVRVLGAPTAVSDDAALSEDQKIEEEIRKMTSKEKEIIGCLLHRNQRVFTNTPDGGHAVTLISKGIVISAVRKGQTCTYSECPFEIPQRFWNVLVRHKAAFPYENDDERDPWRVHWMER